MEGGGASAGQSHRESPLLDGWDGSIMMRTTTTTIIHIKGRVRRAHYQRRVQTPLLPSSQRVRGTSFRRRYPQASYFKQPGRSVPRSRWRRRPPRKAPKRRPPPPPPKPDPPWKRETKSGWARAAVEKDPASHKRQPPSPPKGEGLVRVPKPKPVSSSSQPSLYLIDGQKIRCSRSGVGSSSFTPYVRPVEWHGQDLWSVGERQPAPLPGALPLLPGPRAPPVRSPPASPDRVGGVRPQDMGRSMSPPHSKR